MTLSVDRLDNPVVRGKEIGRDFDVIDRERKILGRLAVKISEYNPQMYVYYDRANPLDSLYSVRTGENPSDTVRYLLELLDDKTAEQNIVTGILSPKI